MSLGPRNKKKEINISMISVNINSTPDVKLLAVTIDDSLKFTNHIKDMCSKRAKKVGVLMRFKNLIPTQAKLKIYKAFILPTNYLLSLGMAQVRES